LEVYSDLEFNSLTVGICGQHDTTCTLYNYIVYIMPKIRTTRTKPPPEGFEDIQ
jgi:hypothetical protein